MYSILLPYALEALGIENERFRQSTGAAAIPCQPTVLPYTSKFFYQIEHTLSG